MIVSLPIWQLALIALFAGKDSTALSAGRAVGSQAWGGISELVPKAKAPHVMLGRAQQHDIAVIPMRLAPQSAGRMAKQFAMIPTDDGDKTSLSTLFDSREHWWISIYLKALLRIPPVTGVYVAMSTVTALMAWALNDNLPFYALQFDLQRIKRGELWRVITPYLNFGQLWLAHFFMVQSVALYMSSVEIAHCARPEKFIEFMAFGMGFISAYGLAEAFSGSDSMTMLSAAYHLHTYVLYYWSRLNEGSVVNCFDLFTLPAETVPAIFLLQNYLLYREFYVADIAAISAAYLYYYFLSDSQPIWPLRQLECGYFRSLYQRFNNEISR